MRFRKRISLGKGAHINLSGSGVSFTGGVKGLSLNTGSKGTFLNTSIPGTGLYDRKKIGGGGTGKHHSGRRASAGTASAGMAGQEMPQDVGSMQVNFVLHDDGNVTLHDPSGHEITNPGLIRQIKASPEYSMELARMRQERMQAYDEQMDRIIHIQSLTPKVYSTEAWAARIRAMQPETYDYQEYDRPKPRMGDVMRDLTAEAIDTIAVRSKRKKEKLIERYVSDTRAYEYYDRLKAWEKGRDAFLTRQRQAAAQFEAESKKKLERKQLLYMQLVQGNEAYVDKAIDGWLAGVSFAFDFSLEYEHAGSAICIDLDLPEIEDLPDTKVQRMANGTVKEKAKSQREKKEDYSRCVYGLAIYFAGNFFNKALGAQEILVSGYTQRRDRSGDMTDDYIYSILFDRKTFETLDYEEDPRENCMRFRNRALQKKDLSFKRIEPYSVEEIMEGC